MDEEFEKFKRDGYVVVKKLFDEEEVDLLYSACRRDDRMSKNSFSVSDGEGGKARLALWNHPGDDIYGLVSRCERIVSRMEKFLEGEVYHYHSKLSFKEPKVGGAFAWHQDYGYWYQNGCLYPHMASCFIALDPCNKENGCLQILKGSHHLGRVEHVLTGGQTGADKDRVDEIVKVLPLEYVIQEPGDALFFHCNILHRSDQNHSENPRLSLICSYNAARNNPYKDHHHPRYTPLHKVSDSQIKSVGAKLSQDVSSFMDPKDDKTIDIKK